MEEENVKHSRKGILLFVCVSVAALVFIIVNNRQENSTDKAKPMEWFDQFGIDESLFEGDFTEWSHDLYVKLKNATSEDEADQIMEEAREKLYPALKNASDQESIMFYLSKDKTELSLHYCTLIEGAGEVAQTLWKEK